MPSSAPRVGVGDALTTSSSISTHGRLVSNDLDAWTARGFTDGEAWTWIHLGVHSIREATAWRAAAFTPAQAEFLTNVLVHARFLDGNVDRVDSPRRWRFSGLPPWWACLCVAAGEMTIDSGQDFYTRHRTGGDAVEQLDGRARARGLDPWRLRVVPVPIGRSGPWWKMQVVVLAVANRWRR